MDFKSLQEIEKAVLPVIEANGCELVETEVKSGKNPSLTFYIDKDGGIDLDTLEKLHNLIDPLLDEIDVSNGNAYTLNCSSPGLTRPFKKERDYLKRIGKNVEIKLFAQLKGEKSFTAKLISYTPDYVEIERNGEKLKINHNQIAKINEAVEFD